MGRLLFFLMGVIAVIYLSSTLLITPSLSESDIEDLFEERATLHNQLLQERTGLINFVASHMAPDFTVISENTVHMPDATTRPMRAQMNKQQYGQYLFGSIAAMSHYSFANDIQSIEIEDSGHNARVSYKLYITTSGGDAPDIRAESTCAADIYLHVNEVITFRSISCRGDLYLSAATATPPAPPPSP